MQRVCRSMALPCGLMRWDQLSMLLAQILALPASSAGLLTRPVTGGLG